jgi:DNA segregation ATPase FtsK/SpoIIIE, S-DNA-T family
MPERVVEERALLVDLDAILGDEKLPAAKAAGALTALAPDWPGYRRLTGKALAERLLVDHGLRIAAKNKQLLDPAVRDALARRSLGDG